MKYYSFIAALTFISHSLIAQNVGINTTNPQASLDVRGNHRVGGGNRYMSFDSVSGRIQWTGASLYAPVFQPIITHSASQEGLYAGGTRLEYRNATAPVFYSDWSTGNGYFKNNLGINNTAPYSPLTFSTSLGEKISLYGSTGSNYGFGIQNATLQIHSDAVGADIAFGYGNSNAFTEVMRIRGNGALSIRGNAGATGQVMQSNGAGGSPAWVSPTNSLYNNANMIIGTGEVVASADITAVALPGLTYTFNTAGNAKVMITCAVQAETLSCFACGDTFVDIYIYFDGVRKRWVDSKMRNGSQLTLDASVLVQCGPGTHTIQIYGSKIGPSVKFGCGSCFEELKDNLIVQVIPE